jgi:hypothetical protein
MKVWTPTKLFQKSIFLQDKALITYENISGIYRVGPAYRSDLMEQTPMFLASGQLKQAIFLPKT